MALSLTAQQKSIIKIFSAEDKYLIPSYQRPYSWDIQQCSELWEDLKTFFDNGNYTDGYFLGNIVIAKSNESDFFEVIDGQQRLITTTLLVKALSLFDNNKALINILKITDRRSEVEYPRLKSAVFEDRDNDYLLECLEITNIPIRSKKNSRFMENLAYFCEKIEEAKNQITFDLSKFSDFVLDNVHLLPIQSEDQEQDKARDKALTIFETINNRGLDLFDADIFKAQLYVAAANESKQEVFIYRWNELVENSLSIKQNIDDIFRIYMHIQRGKNNDRDSEIGLRQFFSVDTKRYKSLKKQNFSEVLNDLEKIVACVSYYSKLVHCENQNPEQQSIDNILVKWFQIIDVYSNNYPKYAIFVYLFNYATITESENLNLDNSSKEQLAKLAENIIRYVYYAGATSTIKFKIFDVIVDISNNKIFEYYVDKISENDFLYFGKIKKGFMLLLIYLNDKQNPICNYQVDNIIKKSSHYLYPDIEIEFVGNYLLVDESNYKTRNKSLDIRKEYFANSSILDIQKLSEDIDEWSAEKNNERAYRIRDKLKQFFIRE